MKTTLQSILLVLAAMLAYPLTSSASSSEDILTCDPYYEYEVVSGTYEFDNLTDCAGGIYCWYVDGVLQTISPEFSWTPTEPGDYEICLNITYEGCSNWYCDEVEVTEEDCSPCHIDLFTHDCGDCIYVLSAEHEFEGEISWLISDGTTATGDVLLHTFDEAGTYTICAMATTDACGSVSECITVTTECGDGTPLCEGGAIAVSPFDCGAEFIVSGLAEGAEISWTINGWFWGSGPAVAYTAWADETVVAEAFITTPLCPDGYTLTATAFIEGCWEPCDGYWAEIVNEWTDECAAAFYADGNNDVMWVEWYVNGEYVTNEFLLELSNTSTEAQVYEIDLYTFYDGCDPIVVSTTVTLDTCQDPCETAAAEMYYEWVEGCAAGIYVWAIDYAYDVQWFVNGEYYSSDWYIELNNTTDDVQVYQIEAFVYFEGCDVPVTLFDVVTLTGCEEPCEELLEVYYEWLEGCTAHLYVWHEDLIGQEWYVNGELYSTEDQIIIDNLSSEIQVYEIEVFPLFSNCSNPVSTVEIITLEPCFDCDGNDMTLVVDFDPNECTAYLEIPGLVADGTISWWINGVEYLSTTNSLWLDVTGMGYAVINPQFTVLGCENGTELASGFDFTCTTDCNPWIGYEQCDDMLYLYAEQDMNWYLNGESIGTGSWLDALLPIEGWYEVCALPVEGPCTGQETCIEVVWEYCPELDLSYEIGENVIWFDIPENGDDFQLTIYGEGIYNTYDGVPNGVDIPGPGTYNVCYWNMACYNDCGDCFVITVPEPETIACFTLDIDFPGLLPSVAGNEWIYVIWDEDGNVFDADTVTTLYDISYDITWDLCLPEGCYTATVFFPEIIGEWFEGMDVSLGDVANQYVTMDDEGFHIQFGLGTADCDIPEVIEEPLAALTAWPNPTSSGNAVQVEIRDASSTLLELRDLHGRLLHRISDPNPREFIATGELKSGVYLLVLHSPAGPETLRLVVQR